MKIPSKILMGMILVWNLQIQSLQLSGDGCYPIPCMTTNSKVTELTKIHTIRVL